MDKLTTMIGKIIKTCGKSKANKLTISKHSNCFHLNKSPLEYKPLSNS